MRPTRLIPILTAVLVIGAASYRSPTAFWAGLAWTLSSVSLLTAVLRSVYCRGNARAWWIGFAVFGGSYFIVSFNHAPLEFVESYLPTSRVFDEIYLASHVEPKGVAVNSPVDAWDTDDNEMAHQSASTYFNFNQIHFRWAWHSLLIILLGIIGGTNGVRIARRRSDRLVLLPKRPSILSLMVGITVFAGVFAALHAPSGLTLNLVFGLFAASLAWAGLEAMLSHGQRRAFWVGYALFGWVYLFTAYGQFEVRLLVYGEAQAKGYLPTSRLLGELFPRIHEAPSRLSVMRELWNPSAHRPDKLSGPYWYQLNRYYFMQIGHAIFGILAGVAGGVIAAFSRARGQSDFQVKADESFVRPEPATPT